MNRFCLCLLAALLLLGVGQGAHAGGRALLVISELDEHGVKELSGLYRKLEELVWTVPSHSHHLGGIYSEMRLLRNHQATEIEVQNLVKEVLLNPSIDAVDVFISLHGSPHKLSFYDKPVKVQDFAQHFNEMMEAEGLSALKSKLGFLYNLSCYGASHIPGFLQMGFKAVIGSRKVNANAEFEYPWVLQSLARGSTIGRAFRRPNSDQWLKWADAPLRWLGNQQNNFLRETDSFKEIGGDRGFRIR